MNLPNFITLTRVAFIVAAAALWLAGHHVWAMWLGVVGGLSDYLDGCVARRLGQATSFGAMLDQFADGFFMLVGLTLATTVGLSPGYLIALMSRELWVAGIRRESGLLGFEIPSSKLGKWNSFFVGWGLLPLFAGAAGVLPYGQLIGEGMIALGVGLNLLSGLGYTRAFFTAARVESPPPPARRGAPSPSR